MDRHPITFAPTCYAVGCVMKSYKNTTGNGAAPHGLADYDYAQQWIPTGRSASVAAPKQCLPVNLT